MSLDLSFVLKGYQISNTAKVIYGLLFELSKASAHQGKNYTYISRQSIADRVGVCEKTARTAIKQLISVGLITEKRIGLGRNNHIYVASPQPLKEETKKPAEKSSKNEVIVETSFHSRPVKSSSPSLNTKEINKTVRDKSISPEKEEKMSGLTLPKGRPTPKRPKRRSGYERMVIRDIYRNYFIKKLDFKKYKDEECLNMDDADALETVINLMSDTMANKGKIYVNGALLTPKQWFDVVKTISQDSVLNILGKIPEWKNVRRPHAYLLSCLYNSAQHDILLKPWYNLA